MLQTSQLRAAFAARLSDMAARLSDMYGAEVPAYTTLLDVASEINQEVLQRDTDATRLGDTVQVMKVMRSLALPSRAPTA
jgi:uncharacterized glyoxalase superfamily metalloenzyme YdcJ